MTRTGTFSNGVIWFGVAVSVSEIEAGIEIGQNAFLPLILGHILGGILLFIIGLIGARTKENAMGTAAFAFGRHGAKFFSVLNILQLLGWIAVLIAQGSNALAGLHFPIPNSIVCIILAVLIALWLFIGLDNSKHIATCGMALLAILFAILTFKLLPVSGVSATAKNVLPFWNAFELSIAMPLSWLPVISDYTKNAKNCVTATAVSATTYTFASIWMYAIGILIASLGETSDIAKAILGVGLGAPGIFIVVFSTVTTNFLAANSAGESAKAIYHKLNPKTIGVIVCALSAILAIWGIVERYVDFLYLIASVFAPMAAVLAVSFYFVKKHAGKTWNYIWNLFAWLIGFIAYQISGNSPVGPSITALAISSIFAFAAKFIR